MKKINETALIASWFIFLSMIIPQINFMNASGGFWVWFATGFAVYHYLKETKRPDKNFGIDIGLRAGGIGAAASFIYILLLSLLGLAQGYVPVIDSASSLLIVFIGVVIFILVPAAVTGFIIQLIYFNKHKVAPSKAYLVPLLFSFAAYAAVSAVLGSGWYMPGLEVILTLLSLSIFAFHALKYYNRISKKPVNKMGLVFRFALIFNIFTILAISLSNPVFTFFGASLPVVGEITMTSVHVINEIFGNIYLSVIAGYWLILLGCVSFYMSEKKKKKL